MKRYETGPRVFSYDKNLWDSYWDKAIFKQSGLSKNDIYPINHFLGEAFIQSRGSALFLGPAIVCVDLEQLMSLEETEVYNQLVKIHKSAHKQSSANNHEQNYQDSSYLIKVIINAIRNAHPLLSNKDKDNAKTILFFLNKILKKMNSSSSLTNKY